MSQVNDVAAPFIETIVHATDLSAASTRAFAYALAFAVVRRASLEILHVGSDGGEADWNKVPAVRVTLERWGLLESGSPQSAVFEELGVRVTKRAMTSRFPALTVADYLYETPADLLVVASEGRDGAARWLRGSVAEAIARWSKTMTLFVPTEAERDVVSLADGNLTLNNVLIPIDRTPDASKAIEFARRCAEVISDGNVTITLLFVGDDANMPRVRAEDGAGWTFQRMRREGDPVEAIVAAAELVQAELIVMPTAGRMGVFEALRGSTTGAHGAAPEPVGQAIP
jgi:nucleotide-binding universal stress UspA family protein